MSKLTNTLNKLEGTPIYNILRRITFLKNLRKKIKARFPHKVRLHGDIILGKALKLIGQEVKITSIVETGTWLGFSTELFARMFPDIQIYTCEINKESYLKAKENLKNYKNVHIFNLTSPKFLDYLIKNNLVGNKPLLYLDAHWGNEWPIEEEMNMVTNKIKSAIIIIDDFKVPGDNRFVFDKYGEKECSLETIIPFMAKNKYNLIFPNYSKAQAFRKEIKHTEDIPGYPILFMNLQKEFQTLSKNELISRFFVNKSELVK